MNTPQCIKKIESEKLHLAHKFNLAFELKLSKLLKEKIEKHVTYDLEKYIRDEKKFLRPSDIIFEQIIFTCSMRK